MKSLTPLLFLLVMCACKKESDRPEEFSGIVLHGKTGAPLPGQVIRMRAVHQTGTQRDPLEAPGGIPVYSIDEFHTTTDAAGKYRFSEKLGTVWSLSFEVVNGQYIGKDSLAPGTWIIYDPSNPLRHIRERYDTLYAELPAFVKYTIKNTGDTFSSDSLFVGTPYNKKVIAEGIGGGGAALPSGYNWVFGGQHIDRVIIDSIPGESRSVLQIKWMHARKQDTLFMKSEFIPVSPGNTTEFNIEY